MDISIALLTTYAWAASQRFTMASTLTTCKRTRTHAHTQKHEHPHAHTPKHGRTCDLFPRSSKLCVKRKKTKQASHQLMSSSDINIYIYIYIYIYPRPICITTHVKTVHIHTHTHTHTYTLQSAIHLSYFPRAQQKQPE